MATITRSIGGPLGSTLEGRLTPQQNAVIRERLLARPLKEVASNLGISIDTVKHHQTAAFRRLGVTCCLQLALQAR